MFVLHAEIRGTGNQTGGTYMENNLIIAIGRQFGSGGHEIGEKLAKKLGIKSTIRS